MKKITAFIKFKDGSNHVAVYWLKGDLPFGKPEMKQWIIEQSSKPVKEVIFMSNPSLKPTETNSAA